MSASMRNVVIIGSGPAGLTAAIYTSRAQLRPMVLQGTMPGGQLTTTTEVENFPGFPQGIMGPELMAKMTEQAVRFGTEVAYGSVKSVDFSQSPFRLTLESGNVEYAKTVIFSTGASPRMLGLPQESALLGYGLSTCATCDGAFFQGQEIAVVGGGDSACEEALFLTKFASKVNLVHRRDTLRASKIMAERVLKNQKINPIWNSGIIELQGSKETGLTGCIVQNYQTNEKMKLSCSGVFYAIGHIPNSGLLKGHVELDENGYVLTKPNSTATSIPGVFACGDLTDHLWRQAITAAGSGCMAAIEAERYLADLE